VEDRVVFVVLPVSPLFLSCSRPATSCRSYSLWTAPDHHVHDPVTTIQIPLSFLQQPPNSTKSFEPCPHSSIPIYAKNVQGGPHCCLKLVFDPPCGRPAGLRDSPRTACRIRIFGLRLISNEGVYGALPCPSHSSFEPDALPRVSTKFVVMSITWCES